VHIIGCKVNFGDDWILFKKSVIEMVVCGCVLYNYYE